MNWKGVEKYKPLSGQSVLWLIIWKVFANYSISIESCHNCMELNLLKKKNTNVNWNCYWIEEINWTTIKIAIESNWNWNSIGNWNIIEADDSSVVKYIK